MRERTFMYFLCFVIGGQGGCTEPDPRYCDENKPCSPGSYCDPQTNSCQPFLDSGPTDVKTADSPATLDTVDDLPPLDMAGEQGKLPNGSACTSGGVCASGHCVDDVCCDSECSKICMHCKIPGSAGTCSLVPDGSDPGTDCAGTVSACSGTCDGTGSCQFKDETTSCGATSCAAGQVTVHQCDGKGGCAASNQDCGGYACNATADACLTACSAPSHCTGTFQCINQACVNNLPLGATCGVNDAACASTHCVDGVCCNDTCVGKCMSCDLAASKGTCTAAPSGADPDGECKGSHPACDGACNGSGGCSYPGSTKSCGTTTCTGNHLTTFSCDGSGACVPATQQCTGYYTCNVGNDACLLSCSNDSECVTGKFCSGAKCLSWVSVPTNTSVNYFKGGIWGSSSTDVWAAGEAGTVYRYNGSTWSVSTTGTTTARLYGIWGSSPTDVWAVGENGTAMHFNGAWSATNTGTTDHLIDVWGDPTIGYWAVGGSGTIIQWTGGSWKSWTSGTTNHLLAIDGTSSTDIWAVGHSGTILHFDGSTWKASQSGVAYDLDGVDASSANDCWVVGQVGTLLRFDGSIWKSWSSGTSNAIFDVWASSSSNVWAVGLNGMILRFNGTTWSSVPSGVGYLLGSVWGSSGSDIWIGGNSSTDFLHSQ